MDNDYHLRIVSYYGDPESRRFGRRVDGSLEELYALEDLDSGGLNIQPPLAFGDCRLSEHDGRQVVSIRFQLSPNGAHGLTLDEALADICDKIFKPNASSIARSLSRRSILGLSAISGSFLRMWHNSLFRQLLREREAFLRRIEEEFEDDYLPDWALASSYASFTGVIFLEMDPSWNLEQITVASISDCITIATSILVSLLTRIELVNPDPQPQEKRWDILLEKSRLAYQCLRQLVMD